MSSKIHVIVIGACWYGSAAANTYLQIDPSVSLVVIDDGPEYILTSTPINHHQVFCRIHLTFRVIEL
jgi:hypothetical protein